MHGHFAGFEPVSARIPRSRNAPTSNADRADSLDRDRSNVSRSLSALREKRLVERRRRLLDDGGHVYRYGPTPLADVQALMHDELDEWTAFVHDTIDSFGPPDE